MDKKYCTALILAGGKGTRTGSDKPKQYIELGGKPLLVHTLFAFQNSNTVDDIILVAPDSDIEYCKAEIKNKYGITKISAIVSGGADRQESAYNGLKAIKNKSSIVMVHDGARPFVSNEIIEAVYKAACKFNAVIPAVKVKDTVKMSEDGGIVSATLDRERLWAVQTPQTFSYSLLSEAYEKALKDGYKGTDDASLAEYAGYNVHIAEGSYSNIKITSAEDLAYAKYVTENT